jgi:hypothetical protein
VGRVTRSRRTKLTLDCGWAGAFGGIATVNDRTAKTVGVVRILMGKIDTSCSYFGRVAEHRKGYPAAALRCEKAVCSASGIPVTG